MDDSFGSKTKDFLVTISSRYNTQTMSHLED